MKKQTLQEALDSVDGSEWIYLGCKKGSGWLAIEQAKDMKNDLAKVEKEYYDKHLENLESAIRKILSAPDTRRRTQQSLDAAEEKVAKSLADIRKINEAMKRNIALFCDDPKQLSAALNKQYEDLTKAYEDCDQAVNASDRCKLTLDNLESDLRRATSTKDSVLSLLGSWEHFFDRKVTGQFRKTTDEHVNEDGSITYGIAMLIEGDERGPYWTYSEVANGSEDDGQEDDDE